MSAHTLTPSLAASAAADAPRSKALGVRRGFLVAAPVLAGLFAIVGAVADPSAGVSGDAMLRDYFANPEALQFKSLGYHWAYAFWTVPALMIVPLVRARGAWLATIAGFFGFLGLSTMPGLLLVDWFDSAIGQVYGMEGHRAVVDAMEPMWGIPVFILPGMIGLALGLPLAMASLWRAGLARWWAFAAAFLAFPAFMVLSATVLATVLVTALMSVVAVALARATRTA